MKHFILLSLLVPLLGFGIDFVTEARIGYFYPDSQTMRDIYRNGGVDYELEGGIQFCDNWQAWPMSTIFSKMDAL